MKTKDNNTAQDVVVYMTDPEAHYVSLVKRGANKTPFRIVKQQKENNMKIIQRLVVKKGTDVSAIQAAVGEEAARALQFDVSKEAGAFTEYVQQPEETFKADTLGVISLADDNSILALCGEMVEKSEGFSISKLLTRKSQKQVVEVPDTQEVLKAEVLKSCLSDNMWREMDALCSGINAILSQETGENGKRLEMVRTLCDNFIATLEVTVGVLKSDEINPRPAEPVEQEVPQPEVQETEEAKPEETANPETAPQDNKEEPAEKQVEPNPEEVEKHEKAKLDALVELASKAACEQLGKSLEDMSKQIAELGETVSKMQKLPGQVISSHEESGTPAKARKSHDNIQSVFAGCFGRIGR